MPPASSEQPKTPPAEFDPQRVFGELVKLLRQLDPSVESAKVVYRGVGKGTIPVPLDAVAADDHGDDDDEQLNPFAPERLTPMQRDVVQAIDEMLVGTVLSYAELADKAGCANSGPFRTFVKGYAEQSGRLEPHAKGWEKIR